MSKEKHLYLFFRLDDAWDIKNGVVDYEENIHKYTGWNVVSEKNVNKRYLPLFRDFRFKEKVTKLLLKNIEKTKKNRYNSVQ